MTEAAYPRQAPAHKVGGPGPSLPCTLGPLLRSAATGLALPPLAPMPSWPPGAHGHTRRLGPEGGPHGEGRALLGLAG